MSNNDSNGADAEATEEAAFDRSEFISFLQQYYRGELDSITQFLSRMDLTTDWAIAVVAALLTLAFEENRGTYVLLVGMIILLFFLFFEARRYRLYDAHRARVRLVEENALANAFDPKGVEISDWRQELSDDLREPVLKVTFWEALERRLKRVYLPMLLLIGLAWLFRITVYVPNEQWLKTASVPGVPGEIVISTVFVYYLLLFIAAFWPREREAKGEFYGEEPGEWKEEE
ncbi:hypothetical protein DMJ13_21450 [halophilic archaeon]|nr:hypothetical protein DMJ13_21450 [halophilic archaeon]